MENTATTHSRTVPAERTQRLANMAALRELGFEPFCSGFEKTGPLSEIRAGFEEGRDVSATGRLITVRKMGKSIFADINDGSDRFQVYVNKKELSENDFKAFKLLDAGDVLGVHGSLFVTRAGEQTIKVSGWKLLSKSLLPLPEKWHGLKDQETRYRQRYLDLIANPDVKKLFEKRSAVIREVRNFLCGKGFVEVETPMMQPIPGGAAARPFETHYTALNSTMYLRIAPELYLKRLLVGGFEKVFELNRNFRNEGLSKTHNPEFTMLEVYQAYSDMNGMKNLVQELILHAATEVFGNLLVGEGEDAVDLNPPWREVPYGDLIKEKAGDDWFSLSRDQAAARAEEMGLGLEPDWDHGAITHEIYEKLIEKTLWNPTFVTRLPAELVPLARRCQDDPSLVDVYELVIAGKEISPGYTELNDPIDQRKRFEEQAGEESHRLDEDFLTALEHGMPPAGGMGLGVDRLVMVLTGSDAIRDVILFPQMRPFCNDP